MSCFLTNVEPYVHSTFIFPGLLPCNVPSVTLSPTAPDSKNEVLVGGSKPGSPTPLNVGETKVEVEVTSADGSNKQVRSAVPYNAAGAFMCYTGEPAGVSPSSI